MTWMARLGLEHSVRGVRLVPIPPLTILYRVPRWPMLRTSLLLDVFLVVAWMTMSVLLFIILLSMSPRWVCLRLGSPWETFDNRLPGEQMMQWFGSDKRLARWVFPVLTGLPAIRISIVRFDPSIPLIPCLLFAMLKLL